MTSTTRCAAALSLHPAPVEAAGECAGQILEGLAGERPDLLICFASPAHVGAFEDVVGALRKLIEPDVLIGGVFDGIAGGGREAVDGPALSVLAVDLGGAHAAPVRLGVHHDVGGTDITGWPSELQACGTLLMFADAATFPVDDFLALTNHNLPELVVVGGVSHAGRRGAGPGGLTHLAIDDEVVSEGAVGVLIERDAAVRAVVSQGCRPIGQAFTVTGAEGNRVSGLASRPAFERLREVAVAVAGGDRDLLSRGLHVGIALDDRKVDLRRGDFLVRLLEEIDEASGSLAISSPVAVGRTVQFQVRDALAADEDLRTLLGTGGAAPAGALLFLGAERAEGFFDTPDHDALLVQEVVGPLPLAGAFCPAEIGPVGARSERHGFAAGVVLFG